MGLLSPEAWNGIGIVAFLIVLVLFHLVAVARGWIVWGPAHNEIVRLKDEALAHSRGKEDEWVTIISTQAQTIAEQRVAGELNAHVLQAIRDAAAAARDNGGATT